MNVLADDDRIVDDDAEHENEREQGNHVDRHAEERHHGDSAQKGCRDADHYPKRKLEPQEQRYDHEDEHEPFQAVGDEQIDAAP